MPLVLSPRNWPLNSAGLKKVLAQTFGDCTRRRKSDVMPYGGENPEKSIPIFCVKLC